MRGSPVLVRDRTMRDEGPVEERSDSNERGIYTGVLNPISPADASTKFSSFETNSDVQRKSPRVND